MLCALDSLKPSIICPLSEESATLTMEPGSSVSRSGNPINTKSLIHSQREQINASPSKTVVKNGQVGANKRAELTRVASEHCSAKIEDPTLDPTSSEFDVCKWANMVSRTADKAGVKFRRASFTFKNLFVSGSGPTSQFQMDVASVVMGLHKYFSFGKKPRTAILKSFDGVTRSGELLLVLGRPGSGCSTFLKTIAGELHGLMVDKDSVIHYNGSSSRRTSRQGFNAE